MSRLEDPAPGCKASKEDLREDGLKMADDCTVCAKLGFLCFVSNHPPRQSTGSTFNPSLTITEVQVEQIPALLALPIGATAYKSEHCSQVFDNVSIREWFKREVVATVNWDLETSGVIDRTRGDVFEAYKVSIEQHLNLKVLNISNVMPNTLYLDVISKDGLYKATFGGRADFVIAPTTVTKTKVFELAICIIEIQSGNRSHDSCETQLEAYLWILMNRHASLSRLFGVYIHKDGGMCRMYKASRNGGDCVYEVDHLFHISQLATVLASLLK